MRTLYIECNMGAAGDMLMAALSELLPDPQGFVDDMNALGLPGLDFKREAAQKCGVTGTHMAVTVDGQEELEHHHEHEHHDHDHEHEHHHHDHDHDHDHDHEHEHHHDHEHAHHHHHHTSMADIRALIEGLNIPEAVKRDAAEVYQLIARAESEVHGETVEQIHFHEVGSLDAVADVVGVCWLMHRLAPQRVVVSPIHVGSGQVRCAHGILPVPAPATALILKDVPIYGGRIRGELCTPTGAALLKHFANAFGDMPVMRVERVGYGMGTKDFEWANCVRAMLGDTNEDGGHIIEFCCNLDDMTGEALGFAMDRLLEAGALDVYMVPIQMKKNRPATMLCVLCHAEDRQRLIDLTFKHTTTIGVRWREWSRETLSREPVTLETPFGPVAAKRAFGHGVERVKPEYDAVSDIARREGIGLNEVLKP